MFHVRSDAQVRVKAQMQEISINTNDVGGYEYNVAVTFIKQINRVFEQQLFEESANGMVGLGSKTPNTLTSYQSNVTIKKSDFKKQSIEEAQASSSTGNIDADESDRQNTARLAAIGVKEAIAAAIASIVGAQITIPILRTTDGSDFWTVDEYDLHQLLSVVKVGAERPSATAIRKMMMDVMAASFDWRESAATNIEQLSTAIAKAATYGVRFHNDIKGLVITANVAHAAQQPWGSELAEVQCKIKAKYLYNWVHDAESIIDMMSFLAAADEQRNRQEATAPENKETANMVTMGIERLQQLVQQTPSDNASTDSDKEIAMAATDSESSADTRYHTRGCKKKNEGAPTAAL